MEQKEGGPILTNQEISRYSRQLLIKEIGIEGQKKLKMAKVLVIGAGGLGSPVLLYLSGAGIGTIGIMDGDEVEESNLHRQVIHKANNVGVNKSESAKQTIEEFNKWVKVITIKERLTNMNAEDIVKDYDLVIDACDNAPTRYLINDICMILKKPLVSGSAV